jgi:tRNA pseudouridine65 synthase
MLRTLAQGDGWIVVAKPPWMLVHRDEHTPRFAAVALQRVRRMVQRDVYPIHRLDRQVSGCLLFATEQELAGPLSRGLTGGEATKRYVALVRGEWKRAWEPVVVDTPMKDENGVVREAASLVTPIVSCAEPRCSLVLVEPRTGRYHQVRRHVRDLHHPVVGDNQHGDTRVNCVWREQRGLRRIALHCLELRVPLPDGGHIEATSPMFDDFEKAVAPLPFWAEAIERLPALGLPTLKAPRPPRRFDPALRRGGAPR